MKPSDRHNSDPLAGKASVTMSDIAREAGVSKNTVSLALRHDPQIPPETRQRIEAIAKRLGYSKNPTVAHLMAELRQARNTPFRATLALLNANRDSLAFTRHPTIPNYVAGCYRRASQMGYALDVFWMFDPKWRSGKLLQTFRSRNIRGVMIVGAMDDIQLPSEYLPIYEQYPCIVTGHRSLKPALSFACTDHHMLGFQAFEHAIRVGYKRPALVLDEVIDKITAGRISSGTFIMQQQLPKEDRTQPFFAVNQARKNPELFRKWLSREKPDVIYTLYTVVREWVESSGLRIPEDIGMMQLEWRAKEPEWAGMRQHNDIVGEAAVDMVISMIHSGERGIPAFPRATLIGSTWVDGATIKKRPHAPTGGA